MAIKDRADQGLAPRKLTSTEKAALIIEEYRERCSLNSVNAFVRETPRLPTEIGAALLSGRTELISFAKPRDMKSDEVAALYQLIGVLVETNAALRDHTSAVAQMVTQWTDAFKHLASLGQNIDALAHFDKTPIEEEE